jgi:hypothetical protein
MAVKRKKRKARKKGPTLVKHWRHFFQPHITKAQALKTAKELSVYDPLRERVLKNG